MFTKWPEVESKYLQEDSFLLVIQVNGKKRAELNVPLSISKEEALAKAKECENIQKHINGKSLKREIYVPGKFA